MTLKAGDYAQAKFVFQGDSAGDLSLDEGDVVRITETIDNNWLVGEKVGYEAPPLSGSFPAAFVEHLSLPSVRTGQKIFLAVQDFMAEQSGDLELAKGDIITGTEAVDESWWRGKNGPLKGIFPVSFVAELWCDDGLRSRSYSARAGSLKSRTGSFAGSRTSSVGGYEGPGGGSFDSSITKVTEPTFAQALVDVSPQLDGELAFQLGDLIEITEIIDEDWFFGRCHNKEGLVSAVCVELLDDGNGDTGAEGVGRITCADSSQHNLPHAPYPPLRELQTGEGEDEYRLRNGSSASYTSENTRSHDAEIVPYAQVLYPFTGQGRSELTLQEGQIVTLIRHVDSDWTEGEVDGKRGLFPTTFVDIVVDCAQLEAAPLGTQEAPAEGYSFDYEAASGAAEALGLNATAGHVEGGATSSESSEPKQSGEGNLSHSQDGAYRIQSNIEHLVSGDTIKNMKQEKSFEVAPIITAGISEVLEVSEGSEIGLVLHTFNAQIDGDVSVKEGDTVEVMRQVDDNWLEVRTDSSAKGLVPCNHVEIIGMWPKGEKTSEQRNDKNSVSRNVSANEASLEKSSQLSQHKDSSSDSLHNSHHSISTKKIHDIVEPEPTATKSLEGQKMSSPNLEFSKPAKSDTRVPPQSLPSRKPSLPPKPALAPKPALKPKPPGVAKPPMEKSQSVGSYKPARPPPLMTAKPFSSLPRPRPHHVMSPAERRLSLSSLDSIIEGEMERAKSRSSSQASDNASEQDSPAVSSANTSGAVSSSVSVSAPSTTSTSLPERRGLQQSFGSSDFLISASASAEKNSQEETLSKSSKDHPWFEDNFSESSNKSFHATSNPCSVTQSGAKPPLTASVSLSEDQRSSFDVGDQRRKSASFAERASGTPAVGTSIPQEGNHSSFVNKAFEMEVDEGKLVDLGGDLHPAPRQVPPVRPVSTSNSSPAASPGLLNSKTKAPPPRPSGPRIAPAPSKVPLQPSRTAPLPQKLVPKRPAPRAPGSGPPPQLQPANLNHHNSVTSATRQTPAKPAAPVVRPAPQPPVRQPPRPVSLATPPPRAPPPRPSDLMTFSPDEPGGTPDLDISDETKREMVKDLKTKLEENKADIKKYEETRLDLQKRLAQAADDTAQTAETRDNLQFVESTLAGLQEEGRGLKENLFSLDPHEARLEKARLLAAQHAAEEEKRKEEERQAELQRKRKRKEQRANVLYEIVDTEKDYLFSLQLCLETFIEGPKPPPGIDLEFLLGNMEEIADVSQKVLLQLEASVLGKNVDDQCIGRCFTAHAEDMKNTYAPYCRNHDDVITVLEKYADPSAPQAITDYISGRLEKMREQMNVFDLAGVLIKPVQRILKYPLLLNELLKNTEDDHPDKMNIVDAIKSMTDVAKAINEYKRRKDLVYKYKKSTDQTFSDKISKLNLHSIKKKSSRMKGRLSTNLGIGLHTKDEAFEREEIKFRSLEKAVKIFHRSVVQFLNDSQELMHCRELFVDDIVEFYSSRPCIEVQKLQEVMTMLVDLFVKMRETIENVVVIPLNTLVSLFNAPTHVIEKRFDKLLDYNNQLGKTENDKELQSARNDYEAMNAQLLDELPKFYNLAYGMLRNCVSAYVLARRDFMDQSLKESCCLLELPSIASKLNVMEAFNIRHTTSYDHVSLLSFIPRGFNPRVDTIKADKARLKGKSGSGEATQATSPTTAAPQQATPGSQSDSQQAYLRSTYPASKLFKVTKNHVASDLMDISLTEGMLVGVVKELDPMGNKERWFLDDGLSKGFAPSTGLTPATVSPANSVNNLAVDDDILSVHSFDSGENVVISGNDGRAVFTAGTLESGPQKHEEEQQKQYHYALYDFTARQPNEASLQAGHPVSVLAFQDVDGNSEWWLVEDADGGRGYAPANYMAPMPYS